MVGQSYSEKSAARGKSLVGFDVGGVSYAADILLVREILNPARVVPLPNTPASIVGVVEHRGEVIPIMDLRLRFGVNTREMADPVRWVVVKSGGRHIALAVDFVTEVFGVSEEQGWNSSMPKLGETTRGISAVYRNASRLVFVIDVDLVVEPIRELDLESIMPLAGEER